MGTILGRHDCIEEESYKVSAGSMADVMFWNDEKGHGSLLKNFVKELAIEGYCVESVGFEGIGTYSDCGDCAYCKAKTSIEVYNRKVEEKLKTKDIDRYKFEKIELGD